MAVSDDGRKGPLKTAKALLGKVVGRVVDAALGTGRPPAPVLQQEAPAPARVAEARPDSTKPQLRRDEGVVAQALGRGAIQLTWSLSPAALERARRVLGAEGELRARVVVVAPDEARVITSEVHDKADVQRSGEWLVEHLPKGARCTASVGLARGERFVSAGHAEVVALGG